MSGFTYYSKKRMYERYMIAAVDGFGGQVTARQAIQATRDFEQLWRRFTKIQKDRWWAMRTAERQARGAGNPQPVHDYYGSAVSDVQYWDDACEKVRVRR